MSQSTDTFSFRRFLLLFLLVVGIDRYLTPIEAHRSDQHYHNSSLLNSTFGGGVNDTAVFANTSASAPAPAPASAPASTRTPTPASSEALPEGGGTIRPKQRVQKAAYREKDSYRENFDGDEQRLNDYLKIEAAVRPVRNASTVVVVEVGLTLIQIIDMHEKDQILTTSVWIDQIWRDEMIKWNPDDYGGLKLLRIPGKKIWRPDLVLYNNAADYIEERMNPRAMVDHNGTVFWPLPSKMKSSCKVDVTYFPFDSQNCRFRFGSWTYGGSQVDIQNKSSSIDLVDYVINGEWDLVHSYAYRTVRYYPCCEEPFPDVTFEIHIRRRTLYYAYHIIYPCLVMSVLALLVFRLPPESGEKVGLGVTVLLAYSVLSLSVAEVLPETSESIPVISIYLMLIMGLSSLSVVATVVILTIHHCGNDTPPLPNFLRSFIRKDLQKLDTNRSKVRKLSENLRKAETEAGGCTGNRIMSRFCRALERELQKSFNGNLFSISQVEEKRLRKNGYVQDANELPAAAYGMGLGVEVTPACYCICADGTGQMGPHQPQSFPLFAREPVQVGGHVTATPSQKRIPRMYKQGEKAGTCFVKSPAHTNLSPVFRQSRSCKISVASGGSGSGSGSDSMVMGAVPRDQEGCAKTCLCPPMCNHFGATKSGSVDSLLPAQALPAASRCENQTWSQRETKETESDYTLSQLQILLNSTMQKNMEDEAVLRIRREWQTLARAIDTVFFWIFLFLTAFSTILVLFIVPYSTKCY